MYVCVCVLSMKLKQKFSVNLKWEYGLITTIKSKETRSSIMKGHG